MTTMELKSLKMDLVEELLSLNDKEMLNRVKNYLKRLKKMEAEKEMEEITKEEILAGIDAGLKEVKLSMDGKLELKSARAVSYTHLFPSQNPQTNNCRFSISL